MIDLVDRWSFVLVSEVGAPLESEIAPDRGDGPRRARGPALESEAPADAGPQDGESIPERSWRG